MFWKNRRHKLPKFPPQVASTFRMLCENLRPEELAELRSAVEKTVAELQDDKDKNPIAVQEAASIGACCLFLLDNYEQFPPQKRALIVGAVRYFAVADDPFDDTLFASGFHDDMCIMNYVLEELGIEDRFFDVR